jgi:hypothetical protein
LILGYLERLVRVTAVYCPESELQIGNFISSGTNQQYQYSEPARPLMPLLADPVGR